MDYHCTTKLNGSLCPNFNPMKIERLFWDSEFFKMNIGKLIVNDEADFNPSIFKKQARKDNFELVYLFNFQKILPWDKVLKAGLKLVDIQVTMSKKFMKANCTNIPFDLRTELTAKERKECYKIAEETSKVSRFYNEEAIGSEKAKAMYRKWIDNTLNQTFSDGIFLVKAFNEVVGIHIIKTESDHKIGYITMIGIDPSFKRKGLGRNLLMQSYSFWANETNIETVKVAFSLQNHESFNFHLKMGFNKIEDIKFIYHYRKI